jgi:hypothetical protein
MNEVEIKFDDMKTLSECIDKAATHGYVEQFSVDENGLRNFDGSKHYLPDDVKITNFYRFEGNSDPEDNSILYMLATNDGTKGLLVDAYGVYSDQKIGAFIVQVAELNQQNSRPAE